MEKRYISEIETDLKNLLNGKRGIEQAEQFKILLNELKSYFPYTTTKYLKQFIESKEQQRFILRDFLSKAGFKTEPVKSQLKQEWVFIKYETEIKNYMLSTKELLGEPKKIKIAKAYIQYYQETLRRVVECPIALTITA